jgi:hypothetical protein
MRGRRDRCSGSSRGRIVDGRAVLLTLLLAASCSNESEPNVPSGTADDPASTSLRILNDCPTLPCQGPLEPGEYRWTFSDPTIDFTIPSPGWTWLFGGGGLHLIADETPPPRHEGLFVPDGIYLMHDPTIASRDCEESSEPGVGRSVSDLVGWLESAPGLTASEPIPVTVGGLEGMQLDIEIDPEWKRTCPFSEGLPAVPLIFNGAAPLGGYHWAIVPDQSLRWFILDSEDGVVIVNVEDDPGGLDHDDFLEAAIPVVESFGFPAA